MFDAERHVLQQVARALQPAARLGRAAEASAVDSELEGETRCAPTVAAFARQPVATLVSIQRRCAVELRPPLPSQDPEARQEFLARRAQARSAPSFLPRALPKRRLPSFERVCDLAFRHASMCKEYARMNRRSKRGRLERRTSTRFEKVRQT